MQRVSSRVLVLLLAAVLISMPVFAAGNPSRPVAKSGFFAAFWHLLGPVLPATEKAHGTMDPNGQPTPSTSTAPTSDAHGTMDPDGHA